MLPRPLRRLLLTAPPLLLLYYFLHQILTPSPLPPPSPPLLRGQSTFPPSSHLRKHLILATHNASSSSLSWTQYLPAWLDLTHETVPAVPGNRGNEAGTYLRWIIKHYPTPPNRFFLTGIEWHDPTRSQFHMGGPSGMRKDEKQEEILLFAHAHDTAWHNNEWQFFTLEVALREFNYRAAMAGSESRGFVNLRCAETPGCPAWIQPHRVVKAGEDRPEAEEHFPAAWRELELGEKAPDDIAAQCCAQFAVSGNAILRRPKQWYENALEWLEKSGLEDRESGRVMEYLWHVIFAGEARKCVDERRCVCEFYGGCFGDEDWMEWRKVKEERVALGEEMEKRKKDGMKVEGWMQSQMAELGRRMERGIIEARERGRRLVMEGRLEV